MLKDQNFQFSTSSSAEKITEGKINVINCWEEESYRCCSYCSYQQASYEDG